MTIAMLLHLSDKDLEEIQQIVTSTKAAKMAKRATSQTADLSIMVKKRSDAWSQQQLKSQSTKEFFNYGKTKHYTKDCCSATKRKLKDKKASQEAKRTRWNSNQVAKNAAAAQSVD